MSPRYTQEQAVEATRKIVEFAITLGEHDLALTALLSAYATIADAHPCCTEICAHMTKRLSEILTDVAASRIAPKH